MNKYVLFVIIFISTLLLTMVAIFGLHKTISLNEYITYVETGYNKQGTIDVKLDEEKFEASILSASKTDKYVKNSKNIINFTIENNGSLSNGDDAIIKADYDKEYFKDTYNVRLVFKPINVKISELESAFVDQNSLTEDEYKEIAGKAKPKSNDKAVFLEMYADFDKQKLYVVYTENDNYYVTSVGNFSFDLDVLNGYDIGLTTMYSKNEYDSLDKTKLTLVSE